MKDGDDRLDKIYSSIMQEYGTKLDKGGSGGYYDVPNMLTPSKIKAELDKEVIGQDNAKKIVAVAAWNLLLKINNKFLDRDEDEYFFEKNNLMLIGNTGCGKTHLIRTLAKSVDVPMTIQDATVFTASGYVGKNVNDIFNDLADDIALKLLNDPTYDHYSSCSSDVIKNKIENSIVYIDEFDKLKSSLVFGKDVNGRAVQEALLKVIEGSEVPVYTKPFQGNIYTGDILFILGGAFSGVDSIIADRIGTKSMGFVDQVAEDVNRNPRVLPEDLIKFGIIPELVGRAATIARLDQMTEKLLKRIFREPQHSLEKQIRNQFKSYDVKLDFSDDAIDAIVKEATRLNLGARGLRIVSEIMLNNLQYTIPDSKQNEIVVTEEMLDKEGL